MMRLPSSSLLDNPHHDHQFDGPCVSAGRVAEHQLLDGSIIITVIIISHHPLQRVFLLFLARRFLSVKSACKPLRCALQPGSLDGGAPGGFTYCLFHY